MPFTFILRKAKTCLFSLTSCITLCTVLCNVIVDFGHFKEPFLREEGNTTILTNSNIRLQIRCKANYPTQWIHNYDDIESKNANGRFLLEWTDRKFSGSIDDGDYDYIAWMHLQHTALKETEVLLCAAVNDPLRDQITVRITPDDTTISITWMRTSGKNETENVPEYNSEGGCHVQFTYLNRGLGKGGHYWQCQGPGGSPGQISFRECGSAMLCQNAYRNIKKLPKCTTEVEELNMTAKTLNGFTQMSLETSFSAGTVLCSLGNIVRAQSYFYSAPPESGQDLRKLELSWDKVKPSDLVWMDPFENEYFVNEEFKTKCHFPKYGFSFDPYGALLQNGTRIIFKKSEENNADNTWVTEIDYVLSEAGHYVVQCLGPIWNTTEWVNKTKSFTAKSIIRPTFEKETEDIKLIQGDENQKIVCSAKGDPKPNITWERIHLPTISMNGGELVFGKVEKFIAGFYVCIAANRFGHVAKKRFIVSVDTSTTIGTGLLIGILSVGVLVVILVAGLIVFYCKLRRLSGRIAYLTYEEVEQFKNGVPNKDLAGDETADNANNASIDCMPYNSKYEVARDKIVVGDKVLGAGAYGTVIKGTIILDSGPKHVAFKTVRRDVDVSYLKALLSELKILAFIGEHQNVVGLVGAWTSNIKHREIFVGVELCKTSLVDFLKSNANRFQNFFQDTNSGKYIPGRSGNYENSITNPTFSTLELLRWAEDIATGMDFLASKKVIHADLAARNVLLSFDMQAKICDFGLARQLVDYNYTKSQVCPLPWKWMAIEALNQMKFSTHSDIWAYGVTLWEMFSLGNNPYPGMAWQVDFVDVLLEGMRMTCPPYANEAIYDVMLKSWSENPKDRPSFGEIMKLLKEQTAALSLSSKKTYADYRNVF